MNIDKHEAETLVRLAASIIDEAKNIRPDFSDPIFSALNGFGDAAEVEALARRVAKALYVDGEDLQIGGKEAGWVDPVAFADTDSLCAIVEVDVFRKGDETLTVRDWAERGWEAVRDLEAPVIGLRNQTGAQIDVDLEEGWH